MKPHLSASCLMFLDNACARVLLRRMEGGYGFVYRHLLNFFAVTALLPLGASDVTYQAPSGSQHALVSVPGVATSESLQEGTVSAFRKSQPCL